MSQLSSKGAGGVLPGNRISSCSRLRGPGHNSAMTMNSPASTSVDVSWTAAPDVEADPLMKRLPFVELKLEHEGVEATRFGDGFFPDAVPYTSADEARIFYWRPALAHDAPTATDWTGACATPLALSPVTDVEPTFPRLAVERPEGWEVVVEGTVAGDSRSVVLEEYQPPSVVVRTLSAERVTVTVDGEPESVPAGNQTSIRLPERGALVEGAGGATTAVTPWLHVRYPGRRTLIHPARGTGGAVFPSFGIDLEAIPNPVPVPVEGGELDYLRLAEELEVDLTTRPYPERVLWQAFAYHAFDPHRKTSPRLTQTPAGLLVLSNPQ